MDTLAWAVLLVPAALFLLANIKALPGIWHVRLFSVLASHLVLPLLPAPFGAASRRRQQQQQQQQQQQRRPTARGLFAPVATHSRSPLLECDLNGHKSNSTFYSDLDIHRAHLLLARFKGVLYPGLFPALAIPSAASNGGLRLLLGGVSCTFRREIAPYQRYAMVSRLLTWDDKWLYVVSHFVRGKTVHASAVSKYVFKHGRRTVAPEAVLKAMLAAEGTAGWEQAEAERARGWEVASLFAGLDALEAVDGME